MITVAFTAPCGKVWDTTFRDEKALYVFRRIAAGLDKWNGVIARTNDGRIFLCDEVPEIPVSAGQ